MSRLYVWRDNNGRYVQLEKALKVNWMKRFLFQHETEWKILLSLINDGLTWRMV